MYRDTPGGIGLSELVAKAINESLPRAKVPCPKCGGQGSLYEPCLEVQEQEVKEGRREFLTKRVCTCILEG